MAALDPYYEQITQALPQKFVREFVAADAAAWTVEVNDFFQRGFRLGANLMLEVLRD